MEFPKTHDIAILRRLVDKIDRRTAERLAPAEALTPYGVTFRYPGASTITSRKDGQQALRMAEQVRDAVLEQLKPYLEAGRPGS